jgi:hypothetical protein
MHIENRPTRPTQTRGGTLRHGLLAAMRRPRPAGCARGLRRIIGVASLTLGLGLGLLAGPAEAALVRINFALDFGSGPLTGQSAFGNIDVDGQGCAGSVCNGTFTPAGPANGIVGATGSLLAFEVMVDGVRFSAASDDLFPDFPGIELVNGVLTRIDFADFGGPPSLTIFGSTSGGWGGVYKDAAYDDSLIADVRQIGDAYVVPEPGTLLLAAGALLAALSATRRRSGP